ncbi:MAG TPA: hypothetical protein GXX18_07700 [Bacillales bacterium]|nr:hypothetical protein [Bacillales bacterium]
MKLLNFLGVFLFNFIFGSLFFFIVAFCLMTFMYIAQAFDWILDPTLDEGGLVFFLILTLCASAIYFPILIFGNIYFKEKLQIKKLKFIAFISVIFLIGFFFACLLAYFI